MDKKNTEDGSYDESQHKGSSNKEDQSPPYLPSGATPAVNEEGDKSAKGKLS